jgi:hypothetical protein
MDLSNPKSTPGSSMEELISERSRGDTLQFYEGVIAKSNMSPSCGSFISSRVSLLQHKRCSVVVLRRSTAKLQ